MKSFFGGDPSKAHFVVSPRYRRDANETCVEVSLRAAQERAKLRAVGCRSEQYFQFRVGDEAGEAHARKRAEAEADRIMKRTGVVMEVCKGCFL